MRESFRVESYRTCVSGVAAWPGRPVGRCVSAADASLSLSLSLSCPSSAAGLTAEARRAAAPLAGYGRLYLAPCSKLPCHARNDVRRPHEVTRDRNLACTHANGRQAHCERYCRAPGGVAGIQHASSPQHASPKHASLCGERRGGMFCRVPGGVAGIPPSSSYTTHAGVHLSSRARVRAGCQACVRVGVDGLAWACWVVKTGAKTASLLGGWGRGVE
jgi:hypothetical protein